MKTKDKIPLNRRIAASIILNIFIINLLPANSFNSTNAKGQVRLEHYLDKARLEQDEAKWNQLAEEGLVSALAAWESENVTQYEDPETYELVKALYEKTIEEKFIEWKATKALEERNGLNGSIISKILETESVNWNFENKETNELTRKITEIQAGTAREQWEEYAKELVSSYIAVSDYSVASLLGTNFSSARLTQQEQQDILNRVKSNYENTLREESYDIIQAEESNLLRNLLYDQYSLRKQTDAEAAQVIATTLANEAAVETTNDLNNIFSKIDTIIESKAADMESAQEAWMEDFTRQMNASLERWDEAEEVFLIRRAEWEKDAANVYFNDEEIWQNAFDTLEAKRQEWNKDILTKINEGKDKWAAQQKNLQTELIEVLKDYEATLQNEKSTKEKLLDVQVSIYNTSREILQMSSQGIQNWYNHWGERYKGLYAYWKTEAAAGEGDSEAGAALAALKDFEDRIEVIKKEDKEQKVLISSNFDNTSYITSEEQIEEVFRMINVWKEYYLKAIQNELNKAFSIADDRYQSLKTVYDSCILQTESLPAEIQELEKQRNNCNTTGEYNNSQDEIEKKRKELEAAKKTISAIQDRYESETTQYEKIEALVKALNSENFNVYEYNNYKELENFDEKYAQEIRDNQIKLNRNIEEIKTVLSNLNFDDFSVGGVTKFGVNFKDISIFLNDDLFINTDTIYGSEESLYTWYYNHIQYVDKCEAAIDEIVELTGNVSKITIPKKTENESEIETIYDELTLEYYKAAAVKDYWEEQKNILEACVKYIKDETSNADTVQQTEAQYNAALELFKIAERNYDAQVKVLEKYENAVKNSSVELEKARLEVLQAFNTLQGKQKEYEDVLASYNGVSNENLNAVINNIIKELNGIEEADLTTSNVSKNLQAYYSSYLDYCILKTKEEREKAVNSLDAVENGKIKAEKKYVKVLNEEKLLNPETSTASALQEFNKISSYNQYENQKLQQAWTNFNSHPDNLIIKEYLKYLIEYINSQNAQNYKEQVYVYNFLNDRTADIPKTKTEEDIRLEKSKLLLNSAVKVISFAVENVLPENESYYYASLINEIKTFTTCTTLEEFTEKLDQTEESVNTVINNILCGHGLFNNQYLDDMLLYGYYNLLWEDPQGKDIVKLEMIESVKSDYSMYDFDYLNKQNSEAAKKVNEVINQQATQNLSDLDYVNKLYEAGAGLDSVGASALDLYIQEYLRSKIVDRIKADSDGVIDEYNDESLSDKLEGKGVLLDKISSWNNANSFDSLVEIIFSDTYKEINSTTMLSSLQEYAAYLAYNDIVINGKTEVLSSDENIKNYLLSLDKITEYNLKDSAGADGFCTKVASIIYDFYNNTYTDYKETQKTYYEYLNSTSEEQSLVTSDWAEKYKAAQTLSQTLSNIYDYWADKKYEKYITKYIVEKGLSYSVVIQAMKSTDVTTLKAYFENGNDKKDYLQTLFNNNLIPTGQNGLYTKIDLTNAINTIIEQYNNEQENEEYKLGYISEEIQYCTDFDIETAIQNEINAAVGASGFESYDLDKYNQEWYRAYLVNSDFFYTYLSIHDADLSLVNDAYNYAKENTSKEYDENYLKLEKFLKIKNTINNYSPYLETSLEDYLNNANLEEDVYKAVYDYFCYGEEYWTESHYAVQKKNLTSYIKYQTDDNTFQTTLNGSKYICNVSKASNDFSKEIYSLLQAEQEKYNEYNFELMCKTIADSHINENTKYQDSIKSLVLGNIETNKTGEKFEVDDIDSASDYSEVYKQYFKNNSAFVYSNKTIKESESEILKKINESAQALSNDDSRRQALLSQLKSVFDTLNENQKEIKERLENVRTTKSQMDEADDEYKIKQENYDASMNTYKENVDNYNIQVSILNNLYEGMEKERLNYRTKKEIYEWAENTYLRSETDIAEVEHYEEEGLKVTYETPQDRLAKVTDSYTAAQISYEVIRDLLKGTNNDTFEQEIEKYKTEFDAYKKAEKNYYFARVLREEVESATGKQRDILNDKINEEKTSIAKLLNISEINEKGEKNVYKVTEKTKDLIYWDPQQEKFVLQKTLSFEPSYSTITNSEGVTEKIRNEKDNTVVIDKITGVDKSANADAINKYLNEDKGPEQKNAYDKVYYERLSQIDAEAWILEMQKKQEENDNYFEKVVLSALYLQYKAQNKEYINVAEKITQDGKEKAQKTNNENFGVYDNIFNYFGFTNVGKSNGVNYPDVMSEKGEIFLQDIYASVSEEDIVKYLLYKDTYLSGRLNIISRVTDYLRNVAMTETIEYAQDEKDGYVAAGVAFTVLAAGFYATAAIPFIGAWALIPAAANTALAAIEYEKARDTQAVIDKINDVKNNEYKSLETDRNYLKKGIDEWAEKTAAKDEALKELNIIIYGSENGASDSSSLSSMDTTTLRNSIETALRKSKLITIEDYDEFLLDQNFSSIIKGAKTSEEALNAIIEYLKSEYDKTKTVLNNKVFGIKQEDAVLVEGIKTQQQASAEKYNELLNEYLNNEKSVIDKETLKSDLEDLAKDAWGTGTFRSATYYSALQESLNELDIRKVMYNRSPEKYINGDYSEEGTKIADGLIDEIVNNYKASLEAEIELKKEAKKKENELAEDDLNKQINQWNTQISYILAVSDSEWIKAKQRLNSEHFAWKENFDNTYEDAIEEWNASYEDFQESKQNWILEQYLNASQGKWEETTADYDIKRENIISSVMEKSGFIGKLSESMEELNEDSESYINSITNTALLNSIKNYGADLSNSAGAGVKRGKKGNTISIEADEWLKAAMQRSIELSEDYQKVSAKLSEQQMKEQLAQTISSYMERIQAQNEGMREWEISLVQSEGYSVNGRTISRNTVIDSTLVKNVKKTQKVAMYEDFIIARPEIPVSAEGSEDGKSMMEQLLATISNVKEWAVKVFGKTNKDGSTVKRTFEKKKYESGNGITDVGIEAKTLVEQYESNAAKLDSEKEKYAETKAEERIKELENKMKEAGGYSKLSKEEQKEYTNLSGAQTTLEDGAINEWIGYAPTFNSGAEGEALDYTKGALENLKYEGKGQMGIIMLDFQWNNMEEGNGFSELAKPMYDKKMWDDDNSIIQPPTFRDVLDIALEVVGNATGQKWIGCLDDALFAVTDLSGGYKTAGEVGLELGKKAATKAVSAGIGKAGEWATKGLTDGITSAVGKTFVQTGVNMTTAAVNTVANTTINSVYINTEGKLDFDTEGFGSSLGRMSAWSGVVSAGISGTMNAFTQTDGLGKALNGYVFNNGGIQRFNALAGSLAASGLEYLVDGETSFNILNAADLFAMFGSEYLDKGEEIDFGNGIKGYGAASTGLFELKFSKEKGISSTIGRGGTDLSLLHTQAALAGAHDSLKILGAKAGNLLGMKEGISTLDAVNGLSYTYDTMNMDLAKNIWNDKIKVKYDAEGDAYGFSDVDNRGTIHLSKDLLGVDGEQMAKLASVMAHEGTHAYGNRIEGIAHAQAGITYDAILHEYGLKGDKQFADAILAGFNDAENWKENSGGRDYWKQEIQSNGSTKWREDGNLDFTLEDGTVITAEDMKAAIEKIKLRRNTSNDPVLEDASNQESNEDFQKIINQFFEGNPTGNFKSLVNNINSFVDGTEAFADASIAAKLLMANVREGNKENIQKYTLSMNVALENAQNSGLLQKNSYGPIDTNNLIGTGLLDSPYFPLAGNILNSTGKPFVKITSFEGWRINDKEMARIETGSYILNEFSPFYHEGWDGIGNGNIVASLNGGLYLDYKNAEGFQVNNTTALGTFNTSHADAQTVMQYINLFGKEGVSLSNNNGTYMLNGIKAGTTIGFIGNTGNNSTGPHAHMSLNNSGDSFANVFSNYEQLQPDTYARLMSGYQTNNMFDNKILWNNVLEYSKLQPNMINYNDFMKHNSEEYMSIFWTKY